MATLKDLLSDWTGRMILCLIVVAIVVNVLIWTW
jgi:hypothetical protein